jgi:O-antigen/teichoic acid export membrane protein
MAGSIAEMSRLKKFTRSLLSSYAFLGVNVLYTLASVPLALKYLSKAEFGLWAVSLQIAGYISLVDLGMSGSISRILIDHKDDRANGRYGGAIQSGLLVGVAQGLITLAVGLGLVWFMAGWLLIPQELSKQFLWLMIGQVFLTAATFVSRIFNQLLYAWQRMDISNYSAIAQLVIGFGVLWIGFYLGLGVFSLLAGFMAGWLGGTAICFFACLRLGFWPKAGEWGRASREQFQELFSYGADLFLITIGVQLIISSQTVLISRQLGLEAATLWSVMTKAFTVISQLTVRIVGNTMPAFAEMRVRGENDRLWSRYRATFITVSVLAGVCGVLFAACNGPFVAVWMHGQFSWPAINNVLLGLWLVVSAQQCCHNSLIMNLKEIRGLKYVYLIEGCVFVGVALAILPATGITGMLVCSLVATTLFTWLCGMWRVAGLSRTGWKPFLLDWQRPLFWVVGTMAPCWLVIEWTLPGAPDWLRLVVNGSVLTLVGIWVSFRYALPHSLTAELVGKLPEPIRRPASVIARIVCGGTFLQA